MARLTTRQGRVKSWFGGSIGIAAMLIGAALDVAGVVGQLTAWPYYLTVSVIAVLIVTVRVGERNYQLQEQIIAEDRLIDAKDAVGQFARQGQRLFDNWLAACREDEHNGVPSHRESPETEEAYRLMKKNLSEAAAFLDQTFVAGIPAYFENAENTDFPDFHPSVAKVRALEKIAVEMQPDQLKEPARKVSMRPRA